MKERYLLSFKNAMFWHFNCAEIKEMLGEISDYFDSGLQSGLSEEEIIEQYGEPAAAVRKMREEISPVEKRRRRSVAGRCLFLAVCFLAMLISLFGVPVNEIPINALPVHVASFVFIISSSMLIWILAGNGCMLEVLDMDGERKKSFVRCQVAILLFFLFLVLFFGRILPYCLENYVDNVYLWGPWIDRFLSLFIIILVLATVVFFRKMLWGNLYLFCNIVQNLSLIRGLFLYRNALYRMDDVMIKLSACLFVPYIAGLFILFVYGCYIQKRGRRVE